MIEGGRTILVVDDDDDVREIVAEVLEQRQHRVVTAHNGADALVVLKSFQVDVVVLDLSMPRVDGRGFLDLRDRATKARGVPVIVVTGSEDGTIGDDPRVQAVIRKPFAADELVAAVEAWATERPRP